MRIGICLLHRNNIWTFESLLPDIGDCGHKADMNVEASDTLVRAARELLRWNQVTLAKKAGVSIATLRRFETGIEVSQKQTDKIRSALQKAGVAFLGPDSPAVEVTEGVALTADAKQLPRPELRIYRPRMKTTAPPSAVQATPSKRAKQKV